MKLCDSGPNVLLFTSFTGQQINYGYTVAIKLEIYVMPFFCRSTLKLITEIQNITYITVGVTTFIYSIFFII